MEVVSPAHAGNNPALGTRSLLDSSSCWPGLDQDIGLPKTHPAAQEHRLLSVSALTWSSIPSLQPTGFAARSRCLFMEAMVPVVKEAERRPLSCVKSVQPFLDPFFGVLEPTWKESKRFHKLRQKPSGSAWTTGGVFHVAVQERYAYGLSLARPTTFARMPICRSHRKDPFNQRRCGLKLSLCR
jgi:hypothetical protein